MRHLARNVAIAATGALVVALVERPIAVRAAAWAERRRVGALHRVRLPGALKGALGAAWLDYTLYVWHVLTHEVAFLWRLHRVHHVDRDLDVSTALRFHALEMLASVPWRVAQIVCFGITSRVYAGWQSLLAVSIFFHHSNVRLPRGLERVLSRLVMTPRLHGIHHSNRPEERNANWSSGLAFWDLLHGTWRSDVPEFALTIGVRGFESAADVALGRMLALRGPIDAGEHGKAGA